MDTSRPSNKILVEGIDREFGSASLPVAWCRWDDERCQDLHQCPARFGFLLCERTGSWRRYGSVVGQRIGMVCGTANPVVVDLVRASDF